MTKGFADSARCHSETLESVEGEPVSASYLHMKFHFTVILLLSFWHQKQNVICPEIKVNNSVILMRCTTLSHQKAIYCTLKVTK